MKSRSQSNHSANKKGSRKGEVNVHFTFIEARAASEDPSHEGTQKDRFVTETALFVSLISSAVSLVDRGWYEDGLN